MTLTTKTKLIIAGSVTAGAILIGGCDIEPTTTETTATAEETATSTEVLFEASDRDPVANALHNAWAATQDLEGWQIIKDADVYTDEDWIEHDLRITLDEDVRQTRELMIALTPVLQAITDHTIDTHVEIKGTTTWNHMVADGSLAEDSGTRTWLESKMGNTPKATIYGERTDGLADDLEALGLRVKEKGNVGHKYMYIVF